jgi:hypothetical protein
MYGWHIRSVTAVDPPAPVPAMRRTYSSWFQVAEDASQQQQQQ